jgi:hypothetical protein
MPENRFNDERRHQLIEGNRMKTAFVLICFALVTARAEIKEWHPTPELLHAVRAVESNNGLNIFGDNGASLGDFQLSEAAWLDVNEWRAARHLKTYRYNRAVFNGFISRVYASNYLTILHAELSRKLKRAPSVAELYAAYNLGLSTFAQCEYKLSHVNPVTREKCRQIGTLLTSLD